MYSKILLLLIPTLLLSIDISWDSSSKFNHNEEEYNRAIEEYDHLKYQTSMNRKEFEEKTVVAGDLIWQDDEESKSVKKYWDGAVKYCEDLNLLGIDDWRLPTKDELFKIVDRERKPRIIEDFKNTSAGNYWSSSVNLTSSNVAWYVQFSDGMAGYTKKNRKLNVRCVRGDNYSITEWYKREVNRWKE